MYEEKIQENEDKMLYCECNELTKLAKENEQLLLWKELLLLRNGYYNNLLY